MKQTQNPRRSRGHRGGRRPNQGGRNSSYESNGPDGKIRGNVHQVIEKYQALARDAMTSGDRIEAENYFQHAEHYSRVLASNGEAKSKQTNGVKRGNGQDVVDSNTDSSDPVANGKASEVLEEKSNEDQTEVDDTLLKDGEDSQDLDSKEQDKVDEGLMRALGESKDKDQAPADAS